MAFDVSFWMMYCWVTGNGFHTGKCWVHSHLRQIHMVFLLAQIHLHCIINWKFFCLSWLAIVWLWAGDGLFLIQCIKGSYYDFCKDNFCHIENTYEYTFCGRLIPIWFESPSFLNNATISFLCLSSFGPFAPVLKEVHHPCINLCW